MPKSRKHRRKQPPRPGPSSTRLRPRVGSAEWLPYAAHLLAVDQAEQRGDARGALDLIEQRLFGPDGEVFWRYERILRLSQLTTLGPWLPRWATSRWLLELALQELGPALARVLRVVEEIHGGWDHVRRPAGEDPRIKVVDHDWVFRQVALYEFGAIERLLRHGSPDLIAGADRIHEWASAPMGGFRYVERRSAVTVWESLMTGDRHETANIGSAALLVVGECVIGRLVPIDDGQMFETVPMRVPEDVARAIAAEPGRWIDVLGEALKDGAEIDTGGFRFGFLTDVPVTVSVLTIYDDLELLDRYPERAARLRERVRLGVRCDRAPQLERLPRARAPPGPG